MSWPLRLTDRLFIAQIIIVVLLLFTGVTTAMKLRYNLSEDDNAYLIAENTKISGEGIIIKAPSPSLLVNHEPRDRWFVIKPRGGQAHSYGPAPFLAMYIVANDMEISDLVWTRNKRQYVFRSTYVVIDGNNVRIIAPRGGTLRLSPLLETSIIIAFLIAALAFTLISVLGITTTPNIVRKTISALREAEEQVRLVEPAGGATSLSLDELPRDVRPLAEAFNSTLIRLRAAYANQGSFLRDAAHELRTPIAILALRAEDLETGDIADKIKNDIRRLSSITEQLLDLQRAKEVTDSFASCNVNSITENVLVSLAPLAIAEGYDVAFEEDNEELYVIGDSISLDRILTNLIQNSIRYGGRQGTITVRISKRGFLEVADEGPGIPPEIRDRVFDPFVRGDRVNKGTGLGLHLVQQMALMHNATVTIEAPTAPGTRIRVRFPKAD